MEGVGRCRIVNSPSFIVPFSCHDPSSQLGCSKQLLRGDTSAPSPQGPCPPGALLRSRLCCLSPASPPHQASRAGGDTTPERGLCPPVPTPLHPPAVTGKGGWRRCPLPEIQPWDPRAALLVLNISFENNSAFNYVRLKIHTLQIYGVVINATETTLRIKPALAFSAWGFMYGHREVI